MRTAAKTMGKWPEKEMLLNNDKISTNGRTLTNPYRLRLSNMLLAAIQMLRGLILIRVQ